MNRRHFLATLCISALGCPAREPSRAATGTPESKPEPQPPAAAPSGAPGAAAPGVDRISKTEAEWRAHLTPEQYHVLREKGTERAFTGSLWNEHRKGHYLCAACGLKLFRSSEKFDSGTGWPSYWAPAAESAVGRETDDSLGERRVEVHCSRCGGHLGHVFEDGPRPTGLRYCINSVSLRFEPEGAK